MGGTHERFVIVGVLLLASAVRAILRTSRNNRPQLGRVYRWWPMLNTEVCAVVAVTRTAAGS